MLWDFGEYSLQDNKDGAETEGMGRQDVVQLVLGESFRSAPLVIQFKI